MPMASRISRVIEPDIFPAPRLSATMFTSGRPAESFIGVHLRGGAGHHAVNAGETHPCKHVRVVGYAKPAHQSSTMTMAMSRP